VQQSRVRAEASWFTTIRVGNRHLVVIWHARPNIFVKAAVDANVDIGLVESGDAYDTRIVTR
jgi:hypothetical protein